MKRLARMLAPLLLLVGLVLLVQSTWIPVKAWLAQQLLEQSWQAQLDGAGQVRPWPWADTWPVARLRQARLGVDQIVLAGASGRVLAFGPGHISGTAKPGSGGNVVLSGHRDTHFAWLRDLEIGDLLVLEAVGRQRHYRVTDLQVVSEREVGLLRQGVGQRLQLLTCYPFDAIAPGTTERYLVSAAPRWL